ncbi:The BTB (BR-C, ttk and bab)/POZ (Pox virus and Zinc finger) domain [Ceratobasidium sp. AG-Ba]|nr:The BTB (BR-C, ttk and bab)/POZ (Pox virus and Zinc finger) domain [Ceratobasidium sp. AG-Ba]QRW07304.1 The BTB (BR-C, ttk and bab)/POZ (Pox virus and Zinc finger) domain [Ceratobasidium sp. AG-Ba]
MPRQPIGRADADSSSMIHHSRYSDSIILKVEGTLFTVHKYQLLKSEVFSDMFSTAQGDVTEGSSPNNPITLDGVAAADFESLLNVLYAPDPRITSQEAVQDSDYISAFRLAHKWNFEELKSNILPLVETQLGDIDKILFARQFDLKEWLISSHVRLCQRSEPPSREEMEKLGLDSVHLIWRLREGIFRMAGVGQLCAPCMGLQYYQGSYGCRKCNTNGSVLTPVSTVGGLADNFIKPTIEKWVQDGCMFVEQAS